MDRRGFLGLAAALGAGLTGCRGAPSGSGDVDGSAGRRHAYGDDPAQVGYLHLPRGERRPGTIVVLHGGFWRAQYGADLGEPLARDLADRGWAAWNLEYRRVGAGGGWPATLEDVAAGVDHLARLEADLDLDRVAVVGHSAGGQLAAWTAARPGLPAGVPGADPRVRVTGVVSQAGVLGLARAAREGVGSGAVPDLLGGGPDEVPDRYDVADPTARLPLGVPLRCVHAAGDALVPISQSEGYVEAARARGDDASLVRAEGDHFSLIDVASPDWELCVEAVRDVLARSGAA